MNLKNLLWIGIIFSISSVLPMHAQEQLNARNANQTATINEADKVNSLDLARACSRLLEGRIVQLQNSIIQHMISVQQMPDTLEVRRLIEQEVVIRFYKTAYDKIWEDKKPSWILPSKVLWPLPIPRDFKVHVETESAACTNAIQSDFIKPITPWFPAVAKKEIELTVHSLTEREMVLLLYGLYAKYFSMFFPWAGHHEVVFNYGNVYEAERKSLAIRHSSPEERALFRRLYTPEEYDRKVGFFV